MDILFKMFNSFLTWLVKFFEPKQTINPMNQVVDESISTIKVKQKPTDNSVPFTYTGTTVSNLSKEKQNPRHTKKTFDPYTTTTNESNSNTYITAEELRREELSKRLMNEIQDEFNRQRLNSKMATSSLYSRNVDVEKARKLIKKQIPK